MILLDEIGGVEMLMPEFRAQLYEVLEGEIPCLGVLKLETSNRNMCSNANINHECVDYHLQLREFLVNQYEADLVRFERKYAADTEKTIGDFLERIF
ncbi:nucleoside-triphosphatase [uncultured Sphaerochaeta sp.]|uniref:nucleoside-triphosphatase n=1 Tax=uncultured Sphaerochaeta sp. TaxID=886478 RepID=UPI002A0A8985|nr:nucleoside-triphosphatase [uncultured Sphaerochaeta sp.]